MGNLNKLAAEALGTFTLVLIGSLAIVGATGDAATLSIGLGFGFALLAALHLFGGVSGGHFNPAVSLGAYLNKRLGLTDMVGYWVAQAAGAIIASLVLLVLLDDATVDKTATVVSSDIATALVVEIVLTAVFVALILKVTKNETRGAFMTIALTLVMIHIAGLAVSGASVNPARTLGPALVGGNWSDFWLYLVGPAVGAVLGSCACRCKWCNKS